MIKCSISHNVLEVIKRQIYGVRESLYVLGTDYESIIMTVLYGFGIFFSHKTWICMLIEKKSFFIILNLKPKLDRSYEETPFSL